MVSRFARLSARLAGCCAMSADENASAGRRRKSVVMLVLRLCVRRWLERVFGVVTRGHAIAMLTASPSSKRVSRIALSLELATTTVTAPLIAQCYTAQGCLQLGLAVRHRDAGIAH